MIVMVKHYQLPTGKAVTHPVQLPDKFKTLYQDMISNHCRIESEILTTSELSVTIFNEQLEEDVDIEITSDNGSYISILKKAIIKLLLGEAWKI